MKASGERSAFYAVGRGTGGLGDWVTLLHPPYTLWHLSYVAFGAAVMPPLVLWRLGGTLVAFFLAVGIGAHALDELHGRPLGTGIDSRLLVATAVASITAAMVAGLIYGGWKLLPFVVVGGVLVYGYNLELFGGRLHSDVWFALAWGAFPVLVGAYTQHWTLSLAAEQLQVVPVHQQATDHHERHQLPAPVEQAHHHRGRDGEDGGDDEQDAVDAGAERPAVQFVQGVGADAHREEERQQGPAEPPQHQGRHHGRADGHVRQVPQRVRRVQQGHPVPEPSGAPADRVESRPFAGSLHEPRPR